MTIDRHILDEATLQRAQNGDPTAMEEICDRLQKPILGFFSRELGGSLNHYAEDMTQLVLYALTKRVADAIYNDIFHFHRDMFKIVQNKIVDVFRKEGRTRNARERYAAMIAPETRTHTERNERREYVAKALSELDPKVQAMIRARYEDDDSYERIGQRHQVNASTVARRIAAGMAVLKVKLLNLEQE